MPLDELKQRLRDFVAERDWEQFHSPKNLSMALAGEAGELLEIFQWLTEEESFLDAASEEHAKARDELADIFIYLIRLADRLGVDLEKAALDKMATNAEKYPVNKARGRATKYVDL